MMIVLPCTGDDAELERAADRLFSEMEIDYVAVEASVLGQDATLLPVAKIPDDYADVADRVMAQGTVWSNDWASARPPVATGTPLFFRFDGKRWRVCKRLMRPADSDKKLVAGFKGAATKMADAERRAERGHLTPMHARKLQADAAVFQERAVLAESAIKRRRATARA